MPGECSSRCPGVGINPNIRVRPPRPPSPRPSVPPGVQIRPRTNRSPSPPPRSLMSGYRPQPRNQANFTTQFRPGAQRPCLGGANLGDMNTTFDTSGSSGSGGGGGGLFDDSRYNSSYNSSGLSSSYYGNRSPHVRTTSTTIITTEEEDNDEDDDDDEDESDAGAANLTYTRGLPGSGSGNATYTIGSGASGGNATYNVSPAPGRNATYNVSPAPGGNATYNVSPAPGGNATYNVSPAPGGNATYNVSPAPGGNATYSVGSSPCGNATYNLGPAGSGNVTYNVGPAMDATYTRLPCGSGGGGAGGGMEYSSDFSDFDYDTASYATTPPSGLYSTYTIDPSNFEAGPSRSPLRGPIPGPGCLAGPSGIQPSGSQSQSKTFTKIIKKVVTESPSSTESRPGGSGQRDQAVGSNTINQNNFMRGIRPNAQSSPRPGQGGSPCRGNQPGGGGGGSSPPGAGMSGLGNQGQSSNQSQGLVGEVQRHLDELESTERNQINCDLEMFQQARRRLVEVTTTISSTQPPVNFSNYNQSR